MVLEYVERLAGLGYCCAVAFARFFEVAEEGERFLAGGEEVDAAF
jgi:hypothetical protein